MKSIVSEQEGNTVRLDVELSEEEVQQALDTTVSQLAKDVRMPGFRKGKVPRNLVVQRFGMHAITHQMLDDHLSVWYGRAAAQSGITPVARPEVDYDEDPEAGKAFTFKATVEVMPKPELGEYKGLEVPREESQVEDAEVDAQVDRLRREFAELTAVQGRPAQKDDYVVVDFSGALDGETVENTTVEDYQYQLGSGQFLPDLEEGIVGMSVGEERQVAVAFPEDYGTEELAGKTVDFTVRLKDLKELVLPDLNDELAKDVSEFATLLELRLDIRQKLQGTRDANSRRRFRNAAIAKAADNAFVELPEVVVEEQAHEMADDFLRSLQLQGADVRQYLDATGTTLESILNDVRPGAETTVKTGAVLDAVAEAEGLTASDEELQQRLDGMAAQAGMEPAEFRSRLEESGRMTAVRRQLVREKAADLIVENAVPTEPVAEPEVPETEGEESEQAGGEAESHEESGPEA